MGRKRYSGSIGSPTKSFELFGVDVDLFFFIKLVVVFGTRVNEGDIVFRMWQMAISMECATAT